MTKNDLRTGEAALVKGFAWHVYPDPATPGALAGESPFAGGQDLPGPDRTPLEPPPDITTFWTVKRGEALELVNQIEERAYLVVTDAPVAPDVKTGWHAEPARLDDAFEIDQRGDRSVRLVRFVRSVETPSGPVQECEFQVDRG